MDFLHFLEPYLNLGGNIFSAINLYLILKLYGKMVTFDKDLAVHTALAHDMEQRIERIDRKVFNGGDTTHS